MTTRDHVARDLTAFNVGRDGARFRMSFVCQDGGQGSLSLPIECLNRLMMTLPTVMRQALRARYHDESLRLVYPAEDIRVEYSSDPKTVIVTLVTPDGFEVSFGLARQQMAAFDAAAQALGGRDDRLTRYS